MKEAIKNTIWLVTIIILVSILFIAITSIADTFNNYEENSINTQVTTELSKVCSQEADTSICD